MSDSFNSGRPSSDDPEPSKRKRGTTGPKAKRGLDGQPVPPISIRALWEERNWTALAGLSLLGVGLLMALGGLLGLHFNLWALALMALGAGLAADGWKRYDKAGRRWDDTARNRVLFGALTALIGLMGLLQINWWGLLLLGAGGWLGYETWQKVEARGRIWTSKLRNRMIVAAVIGFVGLSSLIDVGGAGLLLVVIGIALIIGRSSQHYR